ncbi:UNVERIFIED_CONTAM: hypothetical protein RMT77_006794 [Armadillidium vulgare]
MDLQYLENLDIFINDENKIVTYRWLSLTLSVSSNFAKQMLYHYLQKSKDSDKECKLSVTYLLSGLQFDEELKQDVHKICVVREDDLEKLKSTFKTIYSLHIYSLQKVQIKDLNILYGIDYDNIKEDVFQSAQYSSFSPSSKFRSNVQTKREIPATSPKKNIVTSKIESNDGIAHNKENKFKENSAFQKSTSKKGKGALQSMFANQAKRQETKKPLEVKQDSNIKSNSKSVSDGVKKKGSLDAFVSKGPKIKTEEIRRSPRKLSQDKEDVTKKEIRRSPRKLSQDKEDLIKKEIRRSPRKLSQDKEDVIKKEIDSDTTEVEKKIQLSPKREKNNKTTKSVKKSPERKCKRKSTSADTKSIKRQRIMTLADSSSESSAEEEEETFNESPMPSPPRKTLESDEDDDESPFPPTPKPEESSEKKTEVNKRRKRKLIDKTFKDEKGFFVTEKEYELVTDSDEESPIPSAKSISPPKATIFTSPVKQGSPRKNTKGSPQKKNMRSPRKGSPQKKKNKKSPAKVKQSSITSFFKTKS